MKNSMIWVDRKFDFTLSSEMFPMVVERLRGAPARLEEKVASLSHEVLTRRDGETWTIAETIGHFTLVEHLWSGRLDDFLAGEKVLRAPDRSKLHMQEADFNDEPVDGMLRIFRADREHLVERMYNLTGEQAVITAHHPRLDKPMRVIDSAFFAAEHDDHHLARITDLIHMWG